MASCWLAVCCRRTGWMWGGCLQRTVRNSGIHSMLASTPCVFLLMLALVCQCGQAGWLINSSPAELLLERRDGFPKEVSTLSRNIEWRRKYLLVFTAVYFSGLILSFPSSRINCPVVAACHTSILVSTHPSSFPSSFLLLCFFFPFFFSRLNCLRFASNSNIGSLIPNAHYDNETTTRCRCIICNDFSVAFLQLQHYKFLIHLRRFAD